MEKCPAANRRVCARRVFNRYGPRRRFPTANRAAPVARTTAVARAKMAAWAFPDAMADRKSPAMVAADEISRRAAQAMGGRFKRWHSVTPAARSGRAADFGSDALAEEIVQDAFLRVRVNAPRWRPQARFRTWLYRIVINLPQCQAPPGRSAARGGRRSGRSERCRYRAGIARARPETRRRDRCAGAPARAIVSPIRKASATPRLRPCSRHPCPASRPAGARQARVA